MAKVYVGTYKKYNEGSIFGKWIEIDNLSYDEFVKECKNLHKDESDPEFMIQDYEEFPDGLSCVEWLSESEYNDVLEAINIGKSKINIIDYSDKAIVVVGNTKPIKDILKSFGGRFNAKLTCGAGWVFSKKQKESLEVIFQCEATPVESESSESNSNEKDSDLMEEYLNEYRKIWGKDSRMMDYVKKQASKIIKLSNGGLLCFEKPRIETSFCFGYDYDSTDANNMAEHAKTNKDYFLKENLSSLDRVIRDIDNQKEKLCICRIKSIEINLWKFDIMNVWQYEEAIERGYYKELQEVNDSDRLLILESLKSERTKFEKRLKTYLKKYGLSKIKSWSYCID